jgi:hypothetical protein
MVKYAVAALVGGVAYWAIERYAVTQNGLFDKLPLEADSEGKPKLGLGYLATGAAIGLAAVAIGGLAHKLTGGRVPAGLAVAGK